MCCEKKFLGKALEFQKNILPLQPHLEKCPY